MHLEAILDNNQLDALFLNAFNSCLYMFWATSAHHQEDQIDNVMFVPLIGFVKNTINGIFNANNEYKITKEKA